jgi:hypothetical protein
MANALTDLVAVAIGHADKIALVCGGAFALTQYWRQNHWQRKQFAAEQDRLFRNNPHVVTIVGILNWGELEAPLRPEFLEADPARGVQRVSRKELLAALTSFDRSRRLTADQERLLQSFHRFLLELALLQKHLESGLVDEDDYRLYFRYECGLVCGGEIVETRRTAEGAAAEERQLQLAMMNYLRKWNYSYTLAFVARWYPEAGADVSTGG